MHGLVLAGIGQVRPDDGPHLSARLTGVLAQDSEGHVQTAILGGQGDSHRHTVVTGCRHLALGQQRGTVQHHMHAHERRGLLLQELLQLVGGLGHLELEGLLGLGRRGVLPETLGDRVEQALADGVELQGVEELLDRLAVRLLECGGLQVHGQLQVADQGVELAVAAHILGVGTQVLTGFALDLFGVLQDLLGGAVQADPLGRRLGPHSRDAGQVVRRLPHQSRQVGVVRRFDPVLLTNGRCIHGGDVGDALLGVEHQGLLGDQLEGVTVTGDHPGLPAGCLGAGGEGGHDVVGLEAVHGHGGDVHRLHDLDDQVHLAVELLRGLGPPRLVLGVVL